MAKGSNKKKAGSKIQTGSVSETKAEVQKAQKAQKAQKSESVPPFVKRVELAYDLGNHSAVRALATGTPAEPLDDRALARVNDAFEKTKTDPLVLAIGAGALALALIVALATLGG